MVVVFCVHPEHSTVLWRLSFLMGGWCWPCPSTPRCEMNVICTVLLGFFSLSSSSLSVICLDVDLIVPILVGILMNFMDIQSIVFIFTKLGAFGGIISLNILFLPLFPAITYIGIKGALVSGPSPQLPKSTDAQVPLYTVTHLCTFCIIYVVSYLEYAIQYKHWVNNCHTVLFRE